MGDPDEQLAARCAAGDTAALEVLYHRHVERVWRYAWFRTHSREAAAEIVQETFLRVARSAGQFEGRSAFATWLFAVTRSVAVQYTRQERPTRREPAGEAVLRLIPAADPTGANDEQETRQQVRRAVARLPAAQRDAIALYDLSGMSIREVSEILGWSESRVKVTLFRARRKLRDLLESQVSARARSG